MQSELKPNISAQEEAGFSSPILTSGSDLVPHVGQSLATRVNSVFIGLVNKAATAYDKNRWREWYRPDTPKISDAFFSPLQEKGISGIPEAVVGLVERQKNIGNPDIPAEVRALINLVAGIVTIARLRDLSEENECKDEGLDGLVRTLAGAVVNLTLATTEQSGYGGSTVISDDATPSTKPSNSSGRLSQENIDTFLERARLQEGDDCPMVTEFADLLSRPRFQTEEQLARFQQELDEQNTAWGGNKQRGIE